MILLIARVPVIPFSQLTECLNAKFEFTHESILGLELIVKFSYLRITVGANAHLAL